jgi:DNA polymerase-4
VTLKIRFRPFETHTRSRTLPLRTASDGDLFQAAWSLFEAEPWVGKPVRLIGLGLSGWEGEGGVQGDLFGTGAPEPHPQDQQLDETLDAIRRKFGKGYLQRGLSRRR